MIKFDEFMKRFKEGRMSRRNFITGATLFGVSAAMAGNLADSLNPRAAYAEENKFRAKEVYKIAFVATAIAHSVPAAWHKGMEREAAYHDNIDYMMEDGQWKAEIQIEKMENLINQQVDAIILQAVDAAALSPSVVEAEEAGIPVVNLNLDTVAKHAGIVTMVTIESGKLIADGMAKQLGGKGKIVILQSPPGASIGVDRETGFRQVLKEKYPEMEIIAAQNAEWQKEKGMAVMQGFLQAYDKIDGVYGINDSMAEGAALAAEAAGRLNEMVIWGNDGERDALTMIEQGKLAGTIYTNCFEQGAAALRLAEFLVTCGVNPLDLPYQGVVKIAPKVVTKDNVAEIPEADRW